MEERSALICISFTFIFTLLWVSNNGIHSLMCFFFLLFVRKRHCKEAKFETNNTRKKYVNIVSLAFLHYKKRQQKIIQSHKKSIESIFLNTDRDLHNSLFNSNSIHLKIAFKIIFFCDGIWSRSYICIKASYRSFPS